MLHLPDWSLIELPEHERHRRETFGINSALYLPLLRENECIGLLTLAGKRANMFGPSEIAQAESFRDQALIAIENARMFDETQEALEQQKASAEVLGAISRSVADTAPVFETILDACQRLFGSEEIGIYTIGDDEMVRAAAWRGPRAEEARQDVTPLAESVTGRVIRERRTHHIPDLGALPDLSPTLRDRVNRHGGASLLYAPMLWEESGLGSIVVVRWPPKPFSDREQALLQSFADQAAIAIQNTRLFDEVLARTRDLTEALEQQTATADVLKVISRSAFDLNLATSTILEAAARLCRAPLATLHLRDGEVCRLATQFGLPEAFEREARENPIPVRYPLHSRRTVRAGDIAHFSDAWNDPDYLYKSSAQLGGYRAIVVIPLMREDELVGIFSLGRPEPEPFTQSQIKLTQTFADQAAIAIENARLFNEVKTKTDDLSEALQQQTATSEVLKVISRSAFDLQTVFDTLLKSAVELIGAIGGAIAVREGDQVRFQTSVSGDGEMTRRLTGQLIPLDRATAAGRAILSGAVEYVPDADKDPNYVRVAAAARGRSYLAVPLLRDGRTEGAITLVAAQPEAFTQRHFDLVQTFADQAVIAIENARLFNEVQARTHELAASLDDLRKAQDRLIQSEKLASLGQLTAGIAHEIKNPLNFVNNFAALSGELTDELLEVLAPEPLGGKIREEVDELTRMLKDNLQKVAQHGKRADSIVKNMLLHSRSGPGELRPSDINAILEESLNLAYHGARAEKPGFNITMTRELDADAGMLDVFPQEISRAFLNLISNGFYAAAQRKTESGDPGFEPLLSVSTKSLGEAVEIRIRDNGTGISAGAREKIFNPFFTTKPAGEGTGLGLSMTHDIVVTEHGGTLDVESAPGEFTEFRIVLPRAGGAHETKREQA